MDARWSRSDAAGDAPGASGAASCALSLLSAAAAGSAGENGAEKRRRASESPKTDGSSSVRSDCEAPAALEGGKKPRKRRKGTNTLRKEEKERLADELELLQARVKELRRRAREVQAWQGADGQQPPGMREVRDRVLQNQLEYARAMAIMSGYNLCVSRSLALQRSCLD